MKVQRHRPLHAFYEKLVDAKIGILVAWVYAGGLYKLLEYYDLLWILATWWGSLIFTLAMTAMSIFRGWLNALAWIQKEQAGHWFWQVGRLGIITRAICRAWKWIFRLFRRRM